MAASIAIALTALVAAVFVVISIVLWPWPRIASDRDVFGFKDLPGTPEIEGLAQLEYYAARDDARLAYRFYDSTSDVMLVFIHGSSYHGLSYHFMAQALSSKGVAKVYLPNLRGHYRSGGASGDIAYIGQLEDDLADLIDHAREQGNAGRVILGGHSSGGGLAIRFAGGCHADKVAGYLLLSPVIPLASTFRKNGGWAMLCNRRIFGLLVLNAVGIRLFNGLRIIQFNKPREFQDGTETLGYSYRLNVSYHPRNDHKRDLSALGEHVLVMMGADDEQNDAVAMVQLFGECDAKARVDVLAGVNHLGIMADQSMLKEAGEWIAGLRLKGDSGLGE